jgi:hypothetical protein
MVPIHVPSILPAWKKVGGWFSLALKSQFIMLSFLPYLFVVGSLDLLKQGYQLCTLVMKRRWCQPAKLLAREREQQSSTKMKKVKRAKTIRVWRECFSHLLGDFWVLTQLQLSFNWKCWIVWCLFKFYI